LLVDLVRREVPRGGETLHDGVAWFCLGDRAYCYVAAYTAHVNLGFWEGVFLSDPDGLLEGTGKRMRHVKLRSPSDVGELKIVPLIREAARRVRARK
jgi:hypothetical protein